MNDRRRRDQPGEARPLFDENAERNILGCCLADQAKFWENHGRLKPENFAIGRFGRIWAAMQKLASMSKPIRANMIALVINDIKDPDTPLPVLLAALVNSAPPASEADIYADTVLHFAGKRAVIEALDRARADAMACDVGTSPESMKDMGIQRISASFGGERDDDMMDYADWGKKVYAEAKASLDKGEDGGIGLNPALRAVEDTIGRLLPGKLYVLAGMSSSGKSALARQIAEAAAIDGAKRRLGRGYIASLEMTGNEYAIRHLSEMVGIKADDIEHGNLNQGYVDALGQAVARMGRVPLVVDARPRMTMEQIRSRALKIKNTGGLSLMAIDHLLLVKSPNKMDGLMDRVSDGTIEAKNLAKEFGVPVIMLSQVNEKRVLETKSKWPNSTHLFGGETIMQNADGVAFVHRPEIVLAKEQPSESAQGEDGKATPYQQWIDRMEKVKGKGWIYSGKRRGGESNLRNEMIFHGPTMTFRDP